MRANDRLDGHLVSGHVDGVGRVDALRARRRIVGARGRGAARAGALSRGQGLGRGRRREPHRQRASTTATGCAIAINLIPHTVQNTSLRGLAVGRRVNLEIDLIARYVERMLGRRAPAGLIAIDTPAATYNFAMAIAPIPELVAELAAGRMVILVDEEDRENEGDLVLAADHVTPEAINFMANYGRGLICLTLTPRALRAAAAAADGGARTAPSTAPRSPSRSRPPNGVTTGISAADRARTVQAAVTTDARAERPGAARPHLPAAGAGRRRADARRPYRGRLRPRGDGRARRRPP